MGYIPHLLVTKTHRPNEALILDRSTSEIGTNKRRLGDHALPTLLARLFASCDGLKHLFFTDSSNFPLKMLV